ncbi:N-acetyltransferase 6 [Copidosoma floridanum]|uniref:N-acetyltransferase 6 n=1 Tax=Copidosoma floridanum TaxID=29053 RepID=UPI0006C966C7|nr:N-acetyltransferase 6 [Copidosoma floridanum]
MRRVCLICLDDKNRPAAIACIESLCLHDFLTLVEIMKDTRYNLVQLHKRPDLLQQCCKLLNSEWKRSETARLRSLEASCDKFPVCLILLHKDDVVGHCKVSLVNNSQDGVILESLIIDHTCRSQGLGSMLLQATEDYVYKRGIRNVYLTTKGQEGFYLKNGYVICEPVPQLNGYRDFNTNAYSSEKSNSKLKSSEMMPAGPPPPPMPPNFNRLIPQIFLTIPKRTFMMKKLEP